jgi:phytoene/squalene synthetase
MPGEYQDLEGLSPEMIQQLVELGVVDEESAQLGGQLQQANAIRNSPLPEGRDSGRVYTAAHPLEFAATAAKSIMAGKDAKKLQEKQAALLEKQTATRRQYIEQLMNQQPQPQVPQGPLARNGIL